MALLSLSVVFGLRQDLADLYLQADGVLLNLLRTLALVLVWRINAQAQGKLGPRFYFLVLKLPDQLEEGVCTERLAPAFWWDSEGFTQCCCVCLERDSRVAIQDELDVSIVDGPSRYFPMRQGTPYRL